jgi:PhzF family phenazine biosynthesis protein
VPICGRDASSLDSRDSNGDPDAMTDGAVLSYAAFTVEGRGGNPAGVVLGADDLDDGQRLQIAARVGYSETAFVDDERNGRFRMRYFSPLAEVAFCGHATVAAAVALAERWGPGQLVFDTVAGSIPVDTVGDAHGVTATLTSVATRTRPATPDELGDALLALRWTLDDLDPAYPVHVAYAGNDHLVIAVRTRRTLADLDYDYDLLSRVMAARGWTTVHAIHATSPAVFAARDPFPPGGVIEDPATGAAAAAFGGYLRALGLVDLPATVVIHQGEDMGRPSRLEVRIDPDDDRVRVTGTASPIY